MKKIIIIYLGISLCQFSIAAENATLEDLNLVLIRRAKLAMQLEENLQQEEQETEVTGGQTKSVVRSVIYSAVVPGLGQAYAKSYIKAGLFAAVEIAAWAVNIHYDRLGDDKNAEYERFGDQNWSEQRYWSYIYYTLKGQGIEGFPDYENDIADDYAGRPIIQNWQQAEHELRIYESGYIKGFTHTLPKTKTQQYYEMIGKYPQQFGRAWEDASFGPGPATAKNIQYTNLSKDAENLYDKAGYGSMAALINHVISAVDAGFTTRRYNRRQMRFSYESRKYNGEYVNMFGMTFAW